MDMDLGTALKRLIHFGGEENRDARLTAIASWAQHFAR